MQRRRVGGSKTSRTCVSCQLPSEESFHSASLGGIRPLRLGGFVVIAAMRTGDDAAAFRAFRQTVRAFSNHQPDQQDRVDGEDQKTQHAEKINRSFLQIVEKLLEHVGAIRF